MTESVPRRDFFGYCRPDGQVGIRDHILILGINGLVARAAERIHQGVPGTLLVASPFGRGQYGADKDAHRRQMIGLACNPNVAATLIVGADRMAAEEVAHQIPGGMVQIVTLDDTGQDAQELAARGIRCAAALVRSASRNRRERVSSSYLFLGVECGQSDATSGLVSNPLAGMVVNRLVDQGGRAVFGETIEWLGAEHILSGRAASPQVAEAITAAVACREAAAAATGVDLTGNNPSPENIRGGLSSIEEKSLGAIAKGGVSPIRGVLELAESPSAPGLYVMDGPSFTPESMTGFVAAGVQIMLFTTGVGNSYCSAIAPTIKIGGRPDAVRRLTTQIDFDASPLFDGRENFDELTDGLFTLLLDVASGFKTWGEVLGESGESIVRLHGSL
ncbi:UxaA family hydrolase [Paraburkholderia fungorum]|uniref:Uncharacterized protein n=1 Tax=Paraburkholderia fungorum TaxID=134537 RepID=A0A3R7GXA9_9BURK|nr:UxaA family hydrolase [Paraburkholderia fungorum]RKF50119.1 hypothetical protein BCY88_15270 [Paraburkholderia fungorum]